MILKTKFANIFYKNNTFTIFARKEPPTNYNGTHYKEVESP